MTREKGDSRNLARKIEALGGSVEYIPMIEFQEPSDPRPLAQMRDRVTDFDWIALTSRRAARAFLHGLPVAETCRPCIAAVGASTAAEIERNGWPVDLISRGAGTGDLVADLIALRRIEGKTIGYPCSNLARDEFSTRAIAAGAMSVAMVEAYRVVAPRTDFAKLGKAEFDIAVFTSPSGSRNFVSLFANTTCSLARIHPVSIGPTTTTALIELGAAWFVEARTQNDVGLLDAVVEAWEHINKQGRMKTLAFQQIDHAA